ERSSSCSSLKGGWIIRGGRRAVHEGCTWAGGRRDDRGPDDRGADNAGPSGGRDKRSAEARYRSCIYGVDTIANQLQTGNTYTAHRAPLTSTAGLRPLTSNANRRATS